MFRVMIVDDNAKFRRYIKDTLMSHFPSIHVPEASNWVEALSEIASLPPHMIFMDIRLPTLSGLELTWKIKTDYPEITIVILTGYDLPEYREAAARYKADYFLSKDEITPEKLVRLVEKSLVEKKLMSAEA